MSCTYILDQKERVYLKTESSWGVIPNTTGTATLSGSNYCRAISCDLNPTLDIYTRQDKTGNLSYPTGTPGRERGDWKLKMSLAGNGSAGVVPDMDPILSCLMGQAATVVASTSCTYSLSDNVNSLDIWSFRTDTAGTGNPNQRVAVGSVVNSATFHLNENIATVDFDGIAKLILGSFDFATRGSDGDTAGQSSLTSFPSEPSSPVANGNAAPGYYGSLTMDSQTIATIRSADIKFDMNRKFSQVFGSRYPGCAIAGKRKITFSCELYDGSDTATKDIYTRSYDKATFGATMVIGNVAGNTWTITLSGLQLAPYTYQETDGVYALRFGDSMATSNAGLTEATIAIT